MARRRSVKPALSRTVGSIPTLPTKQAGKQVQARSVKPLLDGSIPSGSTKTSKMKIIFLDNDGVVCLSTEWGKRYKKNEGLAQIFDPLNKKAIEVLNEIIRETDAELVVSSDWKYHATLEQLGQWYELHGLFKRPIDTTSVSHTEAPKDFPWHRSVDLEQTRYLEITKWLTEHPEVTHWVAIDDMDLGERFVDNNFSWGLKNFVRTPRPNEGLKQSGVKEKVLKFLKD